MNHRLTIALLAACAGAFACRVEAQTVGAKKLAPNLASTVDTPLRYHPEGADFVIENGTEFFNRPLYGGHTAFRVDAGDKPEFTLYLPGRGGNLRLGLRGTVSKWLQATGSITAHYRPGGMVYEIRDPLLGPAGSLQLEVYALAATEGLVVRAETQNTPAGLELLWAYGGVTGKRGARDGDIGTERVPISEYFQLAPEFCRGNTFEPGPGSFTLKSAAATIFGRVGGAGDPAPKVADARQWADPAALFASTQASPIADPVVVGHLPLVARQPRFLSLQRVGVHSADAGDPPTYQEIAPTDPGRAVSSTRLLDPFSPDDLPRVFTDAAAYFKQLRARVSVDTPDPYLNAAVGALNVAADAVWDDDQKVIMHGAIAWRTKLLGWRGPYLLDALGWHERARLNMDYWDARQNTKPISATLPPADEAQNLARNEAGLHSNGDISNSHYDMNLVHIDAVFRHLLWTGDLAFAAREWPVIARHLAWEQRLFRRPYGPEKLPLYEAYAAIWASDDLYYGGGGATHSTAYNYYHNRMAARVARLIGQDPAPYDREADLIARALRQYLWLDDRGWYAECRDLLGLQLAHPSAALWTVYHAIDSEAATPVEAWQLTRYVDHLPHIPVRGPGVPTGLNGNAYAILPTSTWMPYLWSINNVCMNEDAHTTLSYWQAGRSEEAYTLLKSSLLACMYLGISPGNVGTMTYLDVYRRESQRDFGDASGILSRAIVEGLCGVRPDALAGELRLTPGFPASWDHVSFQHPDVAYAWRRTGQTDTFTVEPHFAKPLALRLTWPAPTDEIASVTVNGAAANWSQDDQAIGQPRVVVTAPVSAKWEVVIRWKGRSLAVAAPPIRGQTGQAVTIAPAAELSVPSPRATIVDPQHALTEVTRHATDAGFDARLVGTVGDHTVFVPVRQGMFTWLAPVEVTVAPPVDSTLPGVDWSKPAVPAATFETVDISRFFNQRVTEIFKQEYRTPRSPYVSLAIPKQGLGAWAGDVHASAAIDDAGLRALSARNNGKISLPNGAPFATPSTPDAPNIIFTSQWDNFPRQVTIPLTGKARRVLLLMAGSTNPMQSRLDNGEVAVTYLHGTNARLALNNPVNWWPIEQNYLIDDYQFRRPESIPPRVDLKTGEVHLTIPGTEKGRGIPGGAATILDLPLDPEKELRSLTVHTLANDVVIGLMSVTLER